MPQTSEFIGLKQANAALRSLPDVARAQVQQVNDVTAFQVARTASARAPQSNDGSHGHPAGFLRSSILWASRPRSLSAVVGIAPAAFYWKFLEFGTRYLSARPFLRPAADQIRADHQSRLVAALERAATQIAQGSK